MRSIMLAASAALALSACATTQTSAPSASADTPPVSAEAIEAHIRFLADDLLEGRDTGERGYDIAARYVESHFRRIGLQPGGENGYYDPVPLMNIAVDDDRAGMMVDGRALEYGEHFLMGAHATEDQSEAEGRAVFAGYGLHMPGDDRDSYADIDADGKIVVVLAGTPEGLPSDVAAHLGSTRTKSRTAEDMGASALIVIAAEGLTRWNFERMATAAANGRPSMTTPAAASGAGLAAVATVGTDGAEALFAGAETPFADILAAAGEGDAVDSFDLATTVALGQGTTREEIASDNVVGVLPGANPDLAGETVVVTAHLDHIGICEPLSEEDRICNGALDNASGISAMLEGAAVLADGPAPERTIVFVALTAEEKGLLGSAHIAANPTEAMAEPVANINLDMPVMLYEFNDVIGFGAEHSTLGPIAAEAAERAGASMSPDPMPEQSLFVRSDHYNFVREGVPSIFLMTGFSSPDEDDDEGAAFLRFLGGNYHAPGDDLSQGLRFDQGAKFANINLEIIRAVANADERPRWNEDSFFRGD